MKLNNGVAFNILFWLSYFLYEWLGLASLYMNYDKYFINACMALPVSLLFSLLTVHVFFKRLYDPTNKAIAWAGWITTSLVLLLIRRYVNYVFIYPKYFPQFASMPFFLFGKMLVEIVNLYAITGLYALYYFIRSLYKERNRSLKLLQQKTMAELDSLKGQVQPHFVFNMLNNIYATAFQSSPETATLISHLSGFLEYNLYESPHDKIALATELDYLRSYIELQKNRYPDKLKVSFNVCENSDHFLIAPLLLLPLVENAFKHGVFNSINNSWVRIDFSRQTDILSIKIKNSKDKQAPELVTSPGKIGLANVKKRLQLIYPGMHDIAIIDKPDTYLVLLTLKNLSCDQMFNNR